MDPLLSLAFSIQSNKGVYALLLGSGISRAARIPTGWEIVLELVRKLAHLNGEECEPDPVAWFHGKYGKAPDYAELLEMVASTSSERQQVLRGYFEPTEEEQEDGAKQPTKAHRAIAKLVADGYIKIVITTNFDRLMERALDEAGVAPSVLSTPDQIEGALPLVHQRCCVIKVHGDYLDTRLKNTPEELDAYDDRLNRLLDRVFDEFGLVTCGWSADWDVALRAAIERAPNRRFSTYWAAQGKPSAIATKLIEHRAGKIIPIADADSFFMKLQEKVQALAGFGEPHPLSIHAAVATTKRYLAEPRYRIQLHDLINDEAERAAKLLYVGELANLNLSVDTITVTKRVRQYENICKNLVAIAATCGQWGDATAAECWQDVQKRFYGKTASNGNTLYPDYQKYPISLITYAAALGAVRMNNLDFFGPLVSAKLLKEDVVRDLTTLDVVCPFISFRQAQEFGRILEGMERRYAPVNDWLHDTLFAQIGYIFPSKNDFTQAFDEVEMLFALIAGILDSSDEVRSRFPAGSYGHREENAKRVIEKINDLILQGVNSPLVKSKLLGEGVDASKNRLRIFSDFVGRLSMRWRWG